MSNRLAIAAMVCATVAYVATLAYWKRDLEFSLHLTLENDGWITTEYHQDGTRFKQHWAGMRPCATY